MGLDDLKAIGISSHGHLSDIMVNIFELKHPIIVLPPGRVQNSAIYGLLKNRSSPPCNLKVKDIIISIQELLGTRLPFINSLSTGIKGTHEMNLTSSHFSYP